MQVQLSPKFIVTIHPTNGVVCYENHCDIERFHYLMNKLDNPPVQYAFQTENGGFALDGNHRADAMAAYKL